MTEQKPTESREIELRRPPTEILRAADTDSWTQVIGSVAKLADYIAGTEFVPKGLRGKPAATAAAMLYGREVGLPPMTALNSTHVIEGTPSISAEMMRAMVLAEGHELVFEVMTGSRCVVKGRRRGSDSWTTVEWTLDMARAAKLLGKDNWIKWPRRMLQARASSELCELVFPDVIHGFKATEELQDAYDGDGPEDVPAAPTSVQRQGGARKRAAAKKAAPQPQAGADEVPLPDELEDQGEQPPAEPAAGPDQGTDSSSPEAEPASLTPETPRSDEGPAAAEGDPESESGKADDATSTPAPSGSGSSSEPDEDGVVDAEIVGEQQPPRDASRAQLRKVHMLFGSLGLGNEDERPERMAAVVTIIGREVDSTNELRFDEASALIDTLSTCKTRENLDTLLQGVRDAEAEHEHEDES